MFLNKIYTLDTLIIKIPKMSILFKNIKFKEYFGSSKWIFIHNHYFFLLRRLRGVWPALQHDFVFLFVNFLYLRTRGLNLSRATYGGIPPCSFLHISPLISYCFNIYRLRVQWMESANALRQMSVFAFCLNFSFFIYLPNLYFIFNGKPGYYQPTPFNTMLLYYTRSLYLQI